MAPRGRADVRLRPISDISSQVFSDCSPPAHDAHALGLQDWREIRRRRKMVSSSGRMAYRLAVAVWIGGSFLQVWANLAVGIVGCEDNPQNQGFFGVIVASAACAFVARLRPSGMVRAMLATAGVQALLGIMVATAPITAEVDRLGPSGVIIVTIVFCVLWLVAAALFYRSARGEALSA